MKAIEYLRQLEFLSETIEYKIQELKCLKDSRVYISAIDYSKQKTSSHCEGEAPFEHSSDIFLTVQAKIYEEIEKLENRRHEIIVTIQSLGNVKYVKILMKKYDEKKTIEAVADEMGYSLQYIKELHAQAIKALAEKLKENPT